MMETPYLLVFKDDVTELDRILLGCALFLAACGVLCVFSAGAGRMGRGRCVRLWRENDVRVAETTPEIARTDLTELVLECAERGVYRCDALSWLTPPSAAAWKSAQKLLIALGCLTAEDKTDAENSVRITSLGKAALTLGLHPRLACVALSALSFGNVCKSADKKSGISKKERGGLAPCAEAALQCVLAYSPYADSPAALQKRFFSDLVKRLAKCAYRFPDLCGNSGSEDSSDVTAAVLLLAGFPDRIAHLEGDGTYRFPSGRVASLPKKERDAFRVFPEWIVAPVVDAGEKEGRIYRWEALSAEEAEAWLSVRSERYTETEFTEGTHSLRKTEYTCFGKIVLAERRVAVQDEDFAYAVCRAVEKNGIARLPLGEKTKAFLARARFYEAHTRDGSTADGGDAASVDGTHTITKSSEENLIKTVREWLPPFLTGTTLRENAVYDAL